MERMTMSNIQLSVGEWKMRNGEKATILGRQINPDYPWVGYRSVLGGMSSHAHCWRDDGSVFTRSQQQPDDIIAPWTSPIAPGHNPDLLTVEQVGEGWWLPEWDVLKKLSPTDKATHFRVWASLNGWVEPFQNKDSAYRNCTYRTRLAREELLKLIAPKKRLIRVEELPAVCWVGDEYDHWQVAKREIGPQKIHSAWNAFSVQALANRCTEWSSDLRTWNSFEVEEK